MCLSRMCLRRFSFWFMFIDEVLEFLFGVLIENAPDEEFDLTEIISDGATLFRC